MVWYRHSWPQKRRRPFRCGVWSILLLLIAFFMVKGAMLWLNMGPEFYNSRLKPLRSSNRQRFMEYFRVPGPCRPDPVSQLWLPKS